MDCTGLGWVRLGWLGLGLVGLGWAVGRSAHGEPEEKAEEVAEVGGEAMGEEGDRGMGIGRDRIGRDRMR